MVCATSKFIITTLPSGYLLVTDTRDLPQDLYLIHPTEFSKISGHHGTSILDNEKAFKHKVSLSPELEFAIESFSVSPASTICAVGKHSLAVLQSIGDISGFHDFSSATSIFRCFPVCRYAFHPKSTVELVHVGFAQTSKDWLSVLSNDSVLRLFDVTQISAECLLAPYRTVSLLHPQQSVGMLHSKRGGMLSSRISLAKCEPFVNVAFLNEASMVASSELIEKSSCDYSTPRHLASMLPFLVLRSNGDVFFGFVDLSVQPSVGSPSYSCEKGVCECQLAGPLKIQIPECDEDSGKNYVYDLNACSLQVITDSKYAKGVPLVIIASASGSISHYLLMSDTDIDENISSVMLPKVNSDQKMTLHFPRTCMYAVEHLSITKLSSSSSTWLNGHNMLKIYVNQNEGMFSYIATIGSSVFRVSLPWLETAPTVPDSAFISRISDDPTFMESLLSIPDLTSDAISVGFLPSCHSIVVAAGSSLYAIPTSVRQPCPPQEQQILDIKVGESLVAQWGITDSIREEVLPETEDFVAVVQRALARQSNLYPNLLNGTSGLKQDELTSEMYQAATGAVAVLQKEYFGRTDAAARHLVRLSATCDARVQHVSDTLEKRLARSCSEFCSKVVPSLASKIDNTADRLAALVQRLSALSEQTRGRKMKATLKEESCLDEGFAEKLTDVDVNLAQINALYGEVDEKASYLASQLNTFTERDLSSLNTDGSSTNPSADPPPVNLMPLFESLGADVRHITDDLRRLKDDVDRLDGDYIRV